jgi:hypothetical protein
MFIPPSRTHANNHSWAATIMWGLVSLICGIFAPLFIIDALTGAKKLTGVVGSRVALEQGEHRLAITKIVLGVVFAVACLAGFAQFVNHLVNDTGIFGN